MIKKFLIVAIFILGMGLFLTKPQKIFAVDCAWCARIACQDSSCSVCGSCTSGAGKPLGTFKGLGALSDFITKLQSEPKNPQPAAEAFSNFISMAIGIMTVVAFIWFIFVLFTGAIAWLSSGGDKAKLQEAQKKITTSVIGLVIVISAIFLVKLIGIVFGIDILDITTLINNF